MKTGEFVTCIFSKPSLVLLSMWAARKKTNSTSKLVDSVIIFETWHIIPGLRLRHRPIFARIGWNEKPRSCAHPASFPGRLRASCRRKAENVAGRLPQVSLWHVKWQGDCCRRVYTYHKSKFLVKNLHLIAVFHIIAKFPEDDSCKECKLKVRTTNTPSDIINMILAKRLVYYEFLVIYICLCTYIPIKE